MDSLTCLNALPFELKKEIFSRYAKSISCCTGVEVLRGPPTAEKAEYIVPNTFLAWDIYVDGQREFRHGAPPTYFMRHIQWAHDNINNGTIRIGRGILFINAFSLLRYGSRETILAKKALMINLQMGICPLIIFKIWGKDDFSSSFTCVPYHLFFEHFGKIMVTNPLNLEIAYDHYDLPRSVWDRARITARDFGRNPIFFVNHLTERQAHVNWGNDLSPNDLSRDPSWYNQEDDGVPLTLDKVYIGGYNVQYNGMTPIANCTNWDVVPFNIYIPN